MKRASASVTLILGLAMSATAQESLNYGSVAGQVTDPQGQPVAGAQVAMQQVETKIAGTQVTERDGRFRFPFLRTGPYSLSVTTAGFKTYVRSIQINPGSAFQVPVVLEVGGLETTVTVEANSDTIETARSQIAGTVSAGEVESLPLNGRNFLDIALLIPGVAPTNTGSTQLFAETSAVPGNGISVSSQRNFSNSFIVDGVSANDDAAGLSGIPVPVDAVDQFQVVTSGGQAEFGRALGGYVNVVTRSGTNNLHGSVYEFFRDDALNSPNPLLGRALPMRQNQYGASVGGPLRRDRTFFFTTIERRDLNQTGLTTISAANVDAINAKLSASGYPGAKISTGVYDNPVNSTTGVAKLDTQAGHHQMSLRYSGYQVNADNSRGAGGLSAPTASAGLDNIDHSLAFSDTWILSNRTVNETRVQFSHGDLEALPTDQNGPSVSISGVATFGTLSSSPASRTTRAIQIVDTLSHRTGAHALRAGADFLHNRTTIFFPRSFRGAYTFSSLANFLSGTYNNAGFSQTFGDPTIRLSNPNIGLFAQDEWHATARLTVNAGLRYDLQALETIETDRNNLSPRVGLAWALTESRRTLLRASAGIFHDRVPLRALANALLSAGNSTDLARLQQTNVSLSPTQAGAPRFPDILAAAVPVTLPNLTTMDSRLQNAQSRQASVEIEQQLGSSVSVSASYQYLRGSELIVSVNQNVPTCIAAGTNNGCRPNLTYGNNSRYSSQARSTYHGLQFALVQRPTSWGSYRLSYSLSKAMNNVGEFFFSSPIDPTDIEKDWGRSDDDQRHRLTAQMAVHTSFAAGASVWDKVKNGFELGGIFQFYSALPLNITSGVTTIQGTAGRPMVNSAFISRNAGKGPDFLSVGLRLSRRISLGSRAHLVALAEVFNLTNRRNVVAMNGNFGSGAYPTNPLPSFRAITAVGEPRSAQFGLRLAF